MPHRHRGRSVAARHDVRALVTPHGATRAKDLPDPAKFPHEPGRTTTEITRSRPPRQARNLHSYSVLGSRDDTIAARRCEGNTTENSHWLIQGCITHVSGEERSSCGSSCARGIAIPLGHRPGAELFAPGATKETLYVPLTDVQKYNGKASPICSSIGPARQPRRLRRKVGHG